MNKPTVDEVRELIAEILRLKIQDVSANSRFFADLGAESLDLLELSFVAQRRYSVSIERAIKGIQTTREGNLTFESIAFIRSWFPDFKPEKWKVTPSKRRLVDLLTTESITRLIAVLQTQSP